MTTQQCRPRNNHSSVFRILGISGLLIPLIVSGQNFLRNPESIVFDANNNRYLVSNAGNGRIIEIDSENNQTVFNSDQSSIRGLHISGNRLYAAADAGVAIIFLSSGQTDTVLSIPQASFLNDLVTDDSGNLLISDSNSNRIFSVDLEDHSHSTLVNSGISSPNGLLFDETNNRLLLCSFRPNSPIQAIDLTDGSVSTVISTTYDNLDGLARDNLGNIYVSSWGSETVYRFDPDFENPAEAVSSGHAGPADIFYNTKSDILCVPNFNSNTVDFVPLTFGSILRVPEEYQQIQDAIDASSYGDTVLIAPGIYQERINPRGKPIVITSHFALDPDISTIHETVITCDGLGYSDTASCVVIASGEDHRTILQGLTIQGGTGTKWVDPQYPQYTWRGGGGLFMFRCSSIIQFNRFMSNTVVNTDGVDGAQGGAILSYDGDPLIQNNVIMDNEARYGGGIVMDYSGGRIRNNIIANNSGGQDYGGGGFWSIGNGSSPILIENNVIHGNSVTGGGAYGGRGGAMFIWYGTVTARNNVIWGNTQSHGGQIAQVDGGRARVYYSDVQGGFPGQGNIDQDPGFLHSGFILNPGSACIDAGDTSIVYHDPQDPDNTGMARWPAQGNLRNDMGCYGGPRSALLPVDTTSAGIGKNPSKSRQYTLRISQSNPAQYETTIEYEIPQKSNAALFAYDITGRHVATLFDSFHDAGLHSRVWRPDVIRSGTYILRLNINGKAVVSRKIIFIK